MALGITLIGAGIFDTGAGPTYTYASFTPAGDAGIVLAVVPSSTGTPTTKPTLDTPTWLTGAGWTEETDTAHGTTGFRITVWSGTTIASPGADDINITCTSPLGCMAIAVQITGEDTSDFVLQPESAAGAGATSASATLAGALAGSDSAVLGFIAHSANEVQNPSGGETELLDNGHNAPTRRMSAQYEINDAGPTTGASWTTSVTNLIAAMEIKAAAAAATSLIWQPAPASLYGR